MAAVSRLFSVAIPLIYYRLAGRVAVSVVASESRAHEIRMLRQHRLAPCLDKICDKDAEYHVCDKKYEGDISFLYSISIYVVIYGIIF